MDFSTESTSALRSRGAAQSTKTAEEAVAARAATAVSASVGANASRGLRETYPHAAATSGGESRYLPYGRIVAAVIRNPENKEVLKKFVFFVVLLAAVPLLLLLLLPRLLKRFFSPNSEHQLHVLAAVAAVVAVNIVALTYAYSAYREEVRDWNELTRQQPQQLQLGDRQQKQENAKEK